MAPRAAVAKIVDADGNVYQGEWAEGKPHGRGTKTWVDGDVYEGEWKDGCHHGRGFFIFADGDVYDGEWKDNMYDGTGTFTWADGDVYSGEWKGGLEHGRGTKTWANVNMFEGKQRWSPGDSYEGEWVKGLRHGHGTRRNASGSVIYKGEWVEGFPVEKEKEREKASGDTGLSISGAAVSTSCSIASAPTKEVATSNSKEEHAMKEQLRGDDACFEHITEIATQNFERYRADLLCRVPGEVSSRFREGGFSKWGANWLPVLELGPFDVEPGPVRDMWMDMFDTTQENGRDMTHLVLWYGVKYEDRSQAFSFVPESKIVPFEEGQGKGYAEIPQKIQTKLEKGQKLTKMEEQIQRGLSEIVDDMQKDKSERGPNWMTRSGDKHTVHYNDSTADAKETIGREDDAKIETIHYANGDVYAGEVKGGKKNGKGVCRYAEGAVYDGEWKDDKMQGIGTMVSAAGDVYEGEWRDGEQHGRGTVKGTDGNIIYDGEVKEGKMHGWGIMTYPSGLVFEGEWREGKQHGKGTAKFGNGEVYDGQWVEGERHGRCTTTKASGEVFDEEWVDGQRIWAKARAATLTSLGASEGKQTEKEKRADEQPTKDQRLYDERMLRSQRSQQRRLLENVAAKKCEHCGVDDYQYKLRVCSGCNLTLYCSAACQKAARRSHQRICNIISELPPRDADRLALKFDRDKMVDFDAGLRYATKYMANLKHLTIDIKEMTRDVHRKLSAKHLPSFLRSKKGALDSFFWMAARGMNGFTKNGTAVWKELHGLKQLRLEQTTFSNAQLLCDTIRQQSNTLMVLCLTEVHIDWHRAKCRRALSLAIGSCKSLAKLQLNVCVLMDPDLKVLLHDLPNLRVLDLTRDARQNHEFTDNTCGLIARKCPGLQELNLDHHDHLSVRGIGKIFEGCPHLRSFHTSSLKLSCDGVRNLLDVAPQLICLTLSPSFDASGNELSDIIEATGGRTAFRVRLWDGDVRIYEATGDKISPKTSEKFKQQRAIIHHALSRREDPNVANEWEELFEG